MEQQQRRDYTASTGYIIGRISEWQESTIDYDQSTSVGVLNVNGVQVGPKRAKVGLGFGSLMPAEPVFISAEEGALTKMRGLTANGLTGLGQKMLRGFWVKIGRSISISSSSGGVGGRSTG
ncbi:1830_t:CDS:2, partial [Acaulospora colombiana]